MSNNTLDKWGLSDLIQKYQEINAYELKTISNKLSWWKQISKVFKSLEIDFFDQILTRTKTNNFDL